MANIGQFTPNKLKAWIEQYAASGVSADANNDLTLGSDSLPYYNAPAVTGFLPLTGGTLTGALNGTSADFSGNIDFNNAYGGIAGTIATGVGSGSVAMTINDGQGNANITFNHIDGVADQAGNVGRIVVNTDSTSGATMSFEVKDNSAAGSVDSGPPVFTISSSGTVTASTFAGNLTGTADDSDLLNGFASSDAAGNSTIVRRTSSGYIYANFLNLNGSATTGSPSHVWVTTSSDNFLRKQTVANFRTQVTDAYYLGITAQAADSAKLSGRSYSDFDTASTIAGRNSAGDIYARLIRQTYQDQTTISGGIVYRINNSSDNYLRVCTSKSAIMAYLGTDRRLASGNNVSYGANTSYCTYQSSTATKYARWYLETDEDMRLTEGGALICNSNITAYSTTIASDIRLKENVRTFDNALDTVCSLRGVRFNWKRDGKADFGFIAQEVEEIIPEAVVEQEFLNDEGDFLTVDYAKVVGILVEAIKELREEVNQLRG